MKAKDLIERAKDPRFISGIYNYCDRWCERCNFTSRCLTYEQLPESSKSDDPAAHDLNNAKFWEELKEIFKETREMIEEFAAEQRIDLKSIEAEAAIEEHRERCKSAREKGLTKMAERYVRMAMEWLKREDDHLEEAARFDEALRDALEVIRWYQFMPAVKIARGFMRNDLGIEEDPIQNDSNGSIKVALIAMDRSIAAWGRLNSLLLEKPGGIMPILAHLEAMRRHTEQAFPNARDFVRPGFDEALNYLM
ncbi:MAG: hypothetical protein ACREA2_05200 [Blastocatellia bacterium]